MIRARERHITSDVNKRVYWQNTLSHVALLRNTFLIPRWIKSFKYSAFPHWERPTPLQLSEGFSRPDILCLTLIYRQLACSINLRYARVCPLRPPPPTSPPLPPKPSPAAASCVKQHANTETGHFENNTFSNVTHIKTRTRIFTAYLASSVGAGLDLGLADQWSASVLVPQKKRERAAFQATQISEWRHRLARLGSTGSDYQRSILLSTIY